MEHRQPRARLRDGLVERVMSALRGACLGVADRRVWLEQASRQDWAWLSRRARTIASFASGYESLQPRCDREPTPSRGGVRDALPRFGRVPYRFGIHSVGHADQQPFRKGHVHRRRRSDSRNAQIRELPPGCVLNERHKAACRSTSNALAWWRVISPPAAAWFRRGRRCSRRH